MNITTVQYPADTMTDYDITSVCDPAAQSLGRHALIELTGCPPLILSDETLARETIRVAVERANATLLHMIVHRFQPHGLTALGLLSESHISIHTWPETGFVAIDLFTCGEQCHPSAAYPVFLEAYKPARHSYQELTRSIPHTELKI